MHVWVVGVFFLLVSLSVSPGLDFQSPSAVLIYVNDSHGIQKSQDLCFFFAMLTFIY